MRHPVFNFVSAASLLVLSGCGTHVSSTWRDDAHLRFAETISAGAEKTAPEETENIRSTLALADRYYLQDLTEEADRLFQLSSQKSQLLRRSLAPGQIKSNENITTNIRVNVPDTVATNSGSHINRDRDTEEASPLVPHPANTATSVVTDQKPARISSRTKAPLRKAGTTSSSPKRPTTTGVTTAENGARRYSPDRTTIYLTFDDGPSKQTLPIASFLASQEVPATFFVLGSNVKGHEKTIRATIAMGHRIGSHTLTHNLQKLKTSFDTAANEVKRTRDLIEPLGGDGRMVRIPYGASSKRITTDVSAEGAQIFDWDINSYDSTGRGVRDHLFIERTVLNQLRNSEKRHIVLLFHDGAGHETTLAALRDLVPLLKQQGYRFGTLERSEKMVKSRVDGQKLP